LTTSERLIILIREGMMGVQGKIGCVIASWQKGNSLETLHIGEGEYPK
jgi:hypothetical protein